MSLLQISSSGAVFILAVMILRAAALHRLPKITFLVLWESVLLRLVFPFAIPSRFSIYTWIRRWGSAPSLPGADAREIPAVSQMPFPVMQGMEPMPAGRASVSVWFVVWFVGMILLASFFALSCLRCLREFQTALPVEHDLADQWLREHPLRRPVSIKQSDRIRTPLTYGIFRPVILMPKKTDWDQAQQLRSVLLHEYVHIRRFDLLTKLAAALVLCIHWFNPMVWVMYLFFNRDLELACDESVIRQLGGTSKAAYSRMLIHMEEAKSGLLPFCSGFGKNAVEERILSIMSAKPANLITHVSACLVTAAAVCMFATSADVSAGGRYDHLPQVQDLQAGRKETFADRTGVMSVIHESAEILRYEEGGLYIHDVLTNHTDQTITETQYCMLAYDEHGSPLKLCWNFLDSSAEQSFEQLVCSKERLLSHQTEDTQGGWSLYDGEEMEILLTQERTDRIRPHISCFVSGRQLLRTALFGGIPIMRAG